MESSSNINSPSINENSFFNSPSDVNISSSSNDNFFSNFKNINGTTVIIIILILAFLGINIFVYLAKGTEEITSVFRPFFALVTDLFAFFSSTIVGITAAGTRNILDGTTSVIDSGLNQIENTADKISDNTNPTKIKQQKNNNDLSSTTPSSLKGNNIYENEIEPSTNRPIDKVFEATQSGGYEADDAGSSIQSGTNKSGWCYIGEDRGFRSCIEVNKSDNCMSEDIFPSKEVCINPKLRY
jgi:hypothetical protein